MTKKTEQKKNRVIMLIIKTIVAIVVVIMLWRSYSLFTFEGKFAPWYVWGVSEPFKYWQEHIGLPLIEHGKEYKLELSIDEQDSKTYNVYKNEKHHFEFKYPKGFYVRVDNTIGGNKGQATDIKFFKEGDPTKTVRCGMYILYKGWGVGKNWLPRSRSFVEYYIKKGNTPFYFLTKNRQIVNTNSGGNPNSNLIKDNSGLVTYINPSRTSDIINVSFGCERNSIEVMNDIISTFQFIN